MCHKKDDFAFWRSWQSAMHRGAPYVRYSFPIKYTYSTLTWFCRTLTVRWHHCNDENKLCVSCLQSKFTNSALNLSLILANANDNKKAVLSQRWPRDPRYISGSIESLRGYCYSKLSKRAGCRQLGFDVTGNSAIRSADPENPTLQARTKHEVYRITRVVYRHLTSATNILRRC